ncbi:hypothetical protein F4809DRAFT_420395 [Biscogniauxia mediterranea]|nr:hypothetical protein F4809DRAFT_420395 [Biscogniauxia mediterranea]
MGKCTSRGVALNLTFENDPTYEVSLPSVNATWMMLRSGFAAQLSLSGVVADSKTAGPDVILGRQTGGPVYGRLASEPTDTEENRPQLPSWRGNNVYYLAISETFYGRKTGVGRGQLGLSFVIALLLFICYCCWCCARRFLGLDECAKIWQKLGSVHQTSQERQKNRKSM